jgi:hypothetical protein
LERNTAARKKLKDLPPLYTPNIRIPRVIDMVIIPQDMAIVLHHTKHLRSYLLFHTGIENGGEDSRLHYEIECCIRAGQFYGIPIYNSCARSQGNNP